LLINSISEQSLQSLSHSEYNLTTMGKTYKEEEEEALGKMITGIESRGSIQL
jgi:hypothetical protein